MKKFKNIVDNQRNRGCDQGGCGHFGASRSSGHAHQGLDIVVTPGQIIKSPISGRITRHNRPYPNDSRYSGITIVSGTTEVKIFYVQPTAAVGSNVNAGDNIAIAQDISAKYKTPMQPHAHVEIRENGVLKNPEDYFA